MTDTEILDWLEREGLDDVHFHSNGNWFVGPYSAPTLREAVEKAARESGDGA